MGQVVPIVNESALADAWDDYRAHATQVIEHPGLAVDRAYMTQMVRLFARFQRLAIADNAQADNVIEWRPRSG